MLNIARIEQRAAQTGLTAQQVAYASMWGLDDVPAGTVLKLIALQAYAKAHGYQATLEPCGMGRWGRLPCVAVVIPWTQCDETGALVAEGSRTFVARTFRGLRAVLGY